MNGSCQRTGAGRDSGGTGISRPRTAPTTCGGLNRGRRRGGLPLPLPSPVAFAREVLGVQLWAKQEEVLNALTTHRRVAVKAGNGLGKGFCAAVAVLWFIHTHQDAAVALSTAPTFRQVRHIRLVAADSPPLPPRRQDPGRHDARHPLGAGRRPLRPGPVRRQRRTVPGLPQPQHSHSGGRGRGRQRGNLRGHRGHHNLRRPSPAPHRQPDDHGGRFPPRLLRAPLHLPQHHHLGPRQPQRAGRASGHPRPRHLGMGG